MFSCFKSLNKKFICSICSACLLCMTGVSQLRAEGDPLTLGETTVESTTVGTNAFLTNTLQDHVYSSRLLPIFSKKPFLYVDAEGNPKLSTDEIPDQNKIPFGRGTSTSVYIAAMPTDDISFDESDESDESYYDDLTWYTLDGFSWDKLCVRYPGTSKIFYHVVSTNGNINGTLDDSTALNKKRTPIKKDILFDNYFNEDTQMLGFTYKVDRNGQTIEKIAKISMDPDNKGNADFTFSEFLETVSGMNFFLQTDVNQYNGESENLNENLELREGNPYSLCVMMIHFAKTKGNTDMENHVKELMDRNVISYENPYGWVSNGDNDYVDPITKNINALNLTDVKTFISFYSSSDNKFVDKELSEFDSDEKLKTLINQSGNPVGFLVIGKLPGNGIETAFVYKIENNSEIYRSLYSYNLQTNNFKALENQQSFNNQSDINGLRQQGFNMSYDALSNHIASKHAIPKDNIEFRSLNELTLDQEDLALM